MWQKIKINRVWSLLYPFAVYFFIYNFLAAILKLSIGESIGGVACLLISAIVTTAILFMIYKALPVVKAVDPLKKEDALRDILFILASVAICLLANFVISKLPILGTSDGYKASMDTLNDGSLLLRILCNALVVPIMEELLYRGCICSQLSLWHGDKVAIIFSALFFGAFHLNVVQFIYGFIGGLVLGFIYTKTKKLWVPITAHGITNLVVIILSVI